SNAYLLMVRPTLVERSTVGESQPLPSLAESWAVNDAATVYSFHLREGVKWAQCEACMSDEVVLWSTDIDSDGELTPSFPTWLVTEGENAELVQVDELTFEIHYKHPMGLLPRFLSSPSGTAMLTPRHYLSQFHPDHADAADIDAAVAEQGAGDWMTMFE